MMRAFLVGVVMFRSCLPLPSYAGRRAAGSGLVFLFLLVHLFQKHISYRLKNFFLHLRLLGFMSRIFPDLALQDLQDGSHDLPVKRPVFILIRPWKLLGEVLKRFLGETDGIADCLLMIRTVRAARDVLICEAEKTLDRQQDLATGAQEVLFDDSQFRESVEQRA